MDNARRLGPPFLDYCGPERTPPVCPQALAALWCALAQLPLAFLAVWVVTEHGFTNMPQRWSFAATLLILPAAGLVLGWAAAMRLGSDGCDDTGDVWACLGFALATLEFVGGLLLTLELLGNA